MTNCREGKAQETQKARKERPNRGPFQAKDFSRVRTTSERGPPDEERYFLSLIHPNSGSLQEFQMRKMISPIQNEVLSIL